MTEHIMKEEDCTKSESLRGMTSIDTKSLIDRQTAQSFIDMTYQPCSSLHSSRA